ncbi:hypothetical protein [Alteribacter aurantiacus]|uniref:hypothetical protein n=1 Tax=Alteribacter aurantiacus TaxID=254410 RepID=UPI000478AB31|nr:hypothetical protein [Alteribacter aurantiacus]
MMTFYIFVRMMDVIFSIHKTGIFKRLIIQSKKLERWVKMMKVYWFWISLFIIMMTVVGFFVFDNVASILIFGIGVGGIFGWFLTSKKE